MDRKTSINPKVKPPHRGDLPMGSILVTRMAERLALTSSWWITCQNFFGGLGTPPNTNRLKKVPFPAAKLTSEQIGAGSGAGSGAVRRLQHVVILAGSHGSC